MIYNPIPNSVFFRMSGIFVSFPEIKDETVCLKSPRSSDLALQRLNWGMGSL